MNEKIARDILGNIITDKGDLYSLGHYVCWNLGDDTIKLDDEFTINELKAIVWWIDHKTIKQIIVKIN